MTTTMLNLPASLPPGAVLGPERDRLGAALCAQNASWFAATPSHVTVEDDTPDPWVSAWASTTSGARAVPSRPNSRGGRFDQEAPVPALRFRAGLHCGYSVDGIADSANHFTVAVIYRSEARNARTLISVAGQDKSNMIYANESAGALNVADRSSTILAENSAPMPSYRAALLLVGYEPGTLRVAINGGPVTRATGQVPGLDGAAELFIGCRNHRSGLAKTLGSSRISDVIYWPQQMLPDGHVTTPDLRPLYDFWIWNR